MKKDEIISVLQEHCNIPESELINLGIRKREEKALATRLTESQKKWLANYCYRKRITERDFFLRGVFEILVNPEEAINSIKDNIYIKDTEHLNKVCNFMLDKELADLFKEFCQENGIKQYSRVLRGYCLMKMKKERSYDSIY